METALTKCYTKTGESVATANLPMGGFKHTGVAASSALTDYARVTEYQNGDHVAADAGGAADVQTLAVAPSIAAYNKYQRFSFVPVADNTGACTLNVSSVGAKDVKLVNGEDPSAGDLDATGISEVIYDGTNFILLNPATVTGQLRPSTKTIAKALTPVDDVVIYPTGSDGGPFIGGTGKAAGYYDDNSVLGYGTRFKPTGGDGTAGWERDYEGKIYVTWFLALGDGSTDDYTAIEEALVVVRVGGGVLFFPGNPNDSWPRKYNHSDTIEFGANDVILEGESMGVWLVYTGAGTGVAINKDPVDTHRLRCQLKNIFLTSSTGAIAFDFTCCSYGSFRDFLLNYTAANAKELYATGHDGDGPYFNAIDSFYIIGGADKSQIGIEFDSDTSGNLADGPNANVISNVKRLASLSKGINLIAGTGNMITNFGGESIKDGFIVLNDVPIKDSGTSTSVTTTGLVDTSKTWSTVQGNPLNFINSTVVLTSGTYSGQARRVTLNTVDTLTLDKPWPDDPGATVTYEIYSDKAVKNMFTNIRQEGLSSDNPDGIVFKPGSRGNELSHIEIGSIGTGEIVNDESGEQTNKARQGDLIIDTFIVVNPGASANMEIVPRVSVVGGIRAGSRMTLDYIEINSPNFVVGSAEAVLTVDHGGATTGAGAPSLVAKVNDFNPKIAFAPNYAKVGKSTLNTGIFVNLTTNANVNAGSDFIIKVAYQVQ